MNMQLLRAGDSIMIVIEKYLKMVSGIALSYRFIPLLYFYAGGVR